MAKRISSIDDLPFVGHDAAGRRIDWHPLAKRDTVSHSSAVRRGAHFFESVSHLASIDEHSVGEVLHRALCSEGWDGACGEEQGFALAVIEAAIFGLRVMREGRFVA